jgi:hypothetical protein
MLLTTLDSVQEQQQAGFWRMSENGTHFTLSMGLQGETGLEEVRRALESLAQNSCDGRPSASLTAFTVQLHNQLSLTHTKKLLMQFIKYEPILHLLRPEGTFAGLSNSEAVKDSVGESSLPEKYALERISACGTVEELVQLAYPTKSPYQLEIPRRPDDPVEFPLFGDKRCSITKDFLEHLFMWTAFLLRFTSNSISINEPLAFRTGRTASYKVRTLLDVVLQSDTLCSFFTPLSRTLREAFPSERCEVASVKADTAMEIVRLHDQASATNIPLFSYGSNSVKSLQGRFETTRHMEAYRCELLHHKRVFAGYSNQWGGSVATIIPSRDDTVRGVLVYISEQERAKLDVFEGVRTVSLCYNIFDC